MTREGALAVLQTMYPGCTDADPLLLDAICKAVADESERCAKLIDKNIAHHNEMLAEGGPAAIWHEYSAALLKDMAMFIREGYQP